MTIILTTLYEYIIILLQLLQGEAEREYSKKQSPQHLIFGAIDLFRVLFKLYVGTERMKNVTNYHREDAMSKKIHDKTRKIVRFADLASQWLLSVSRGVKESTLAHYNYTLNRYLLPVFGEISLSSLDEQRLERGFLDVICATKGNHKPLGASSSRECLTLLRRICKYAAHLHLMCSIEILVKLPQEVRAQTKPLSTREQAALRDFVLAAPTPRKVGLLLQMQLGLRIGEVCGLQWRDFDFKAGTLTIRCTVRRIYCGAGKTKIVVQTPKTKSSGREIPIPHDLAVLLRQLRGNAKPNVWFLSGNAEKPVEPRCYRKSIQGYLRRASVRRVHPHALRHTFATTCLQTGCDIKTLSEILGHADANITLKRYVHTDMKRKKLEMQRVFSAVWKKRPTQVHSLA